MAIPVKIAENQWISFSMGAIWAIAAAALVGVGALCEGVSKMTTMVNSLDDFKVSMTKFQNSVESDSKLVNQKLGHVIEWEKAADTRRAVIIPTTANKESIDEWGRLIESGNADVIHADPTKKGLVIPEITIKPTQGLPDVKAGQFAPSEQKNDNS